MSYTYRGGQVDKPRKKPGAAPKPHDPTLCGTVAGYRQHVRFRDEKCQPCRDAINAHQDKLRKARKAAA